MIDSYNFLPDFVSFFCDLAFNLRLLFNSNFLSFTFDLAFILTYFFSFAPLWITPFALLFIKGFFLLYLHAHSKTHIVYQCSDQRSPPYLFASLVQISEMKFPPSIFTIYQRSQWRNPPTSPYVISCPRADRITDSIC